MKNKFKLLLLTIVIGTLSLNAQSLRIEPAELLKNISEYTVLDTRTTNLYKRGHIKTALSLMSRTNIKSMMSRS